MRASAVCALVALVAQGRPGRGQGVVEYGLILSLTVLFTVVILGVFGGTLSDVLSAIANAIDAATGG